MKTRDGYIVLDRELLRQIHPLFGGRDRLVGFCPFHAGSNSRDLTIHQPWGTFRCEVCDAFGYTEEGLALIRAYNRNQQLLDVNELRRRQRRSRSSVSCGPAGGYL